MFQRKITITYAASQATPQPCPIKWLDSFAMRNFTNDAIFDDTLPLADGHMEIGNRVPIELLTQAMTDWFHRKSYLKKEEGLQITEPLPLSPIP